MSPKPDKRKQAAAATRGRILEAAERLFAEHGIDGVSVRTIAAAAHVDVAMINYHFSSKAGLFHAVFRRRADPLNAMRLQALGAALPRSRGRPDLERVIYALAAPNIYLRHLPDMGGVPFGRIVVREMTDPKGEQRRLVAEAFDPVVEKFLRALGEALPGAPRKALLWAYHFTIGTLIQTMASTGRLEKLSGGLCTFKDPEEVLSYLVPFIMHGIAGCVKHSRPRESSPRRRRATSRRRASGAPSRSARPA
jgi:AcrR family transcriptional regulator